MRLAIVESNYAKKDNLMIHLQERSNFALKVIVARSVDRQSQLVSIFELKKECKVQSGTQSQSCLDTAQMVCCY